MKFAWYSPVWDGIINPLLLFAVLALIGLLWDLRVLSTRSWLAMAYVTVLGWVCHFDYLVFVSGTPTLRPLTAWAPWPARLAIYAAACAFLLWGIRGWVFAKAGPEKTAALRGLPYLRELWANRRNRDECQK